VTDQLGINFDLSRDEQAVLDLIERGRDKARSVRFIASMTGLNERKVRAVVRLLIDGHGACIGSSVGRPPGYYIITDPDEIERHYKELRHRGISILARAAKLKKISINKVFGQGEL
jgi:hypothetical protein